MADLEGEIVLITDHSQGPGKKFVAKKYHLEQVNKSAAFKQLIENISVRFHLSTAHVTAFIRTL